MTTITFSDSNFTFDVVTNANMSEAELHNKVDEYVGNWYDLDNYPEAEQEPVGDWVIYCFKEYDGIDVDVTNWID